MKTFYVREYVRNLNLRVQVHPGELWVSKQRVHIKYFSSFVAVKIGKKSAVNVFPLCKYLAMLVIWPWYPENNIQIIRFSNLLLGSFFDKKNKNQFLIWYFRVFLLCTIGTVCFFCKIRCTYGNFLESTNTLDQTWRCPCIIKNYHRWILTMV